MNAEEIIQALINRLDEIILMSDKEIAYRKGKIEAYEDCIGRLGVVLGKLKEGEQNNEQAQTH